MSRISWEEYAMSIAKVASFRSEDPFRKVGACALSYSNEILAVAYNGLKSGFDGLSGFWSDRDKRRPYMIHAETNLLSMFKRDKCRMIAVTLLPCECCARLIAAWNIPKVIYLEKYDHSSAQNTLNIFDFYKIEIENIVV